MAVLIKTIDILKEHVAINVNTEYATVSPYIKQAERKYVKSITGSAMYTAITAENYAPTANAKVVFELLQEAAANLAVFLYTPLANVQFSDNGIAVSQGEHHKSAEWWQVRDLRRSFLDAGFQALDEALKVMEANEGDFTAWVGTSGYTIFKELFVKRTDTFQRWFNISNSRRTFLAMRPYMLESHHQYFTSVLNTTTIEQIKTFSTEDLTTPEAQVLDHLQAAQVNYTVAKALHSGSFELTATGIYEKMDDFPGYKTKSVDETQLNNAKNDRLIAAEEHFKKAVKIIAANTAIFTAYETKDPAEYLQPKNTKSILSI